MGWGGRYSGFGEMEVVLVFWLGVVGVLFL